MGDVVSLATVGVRKTHIMYMANLSYEQVNLYLGELIEKSLVQQDVEENGISYRATEKGREFLKHYQQISEFLKEPEIFAMQYVAS